MSLKTKLSIVFVVFAVLIICIVLLEFPEPNDGVQIRFGDPNDFKLGDYWSINFSLDPNGLVEIELDGIAGGLSKAAELVFKHHLQHQCDNYIKQKSEGGYIPKNPEKGEDITEYDPNYVFVIQRSKHTVRFQGNIILGGDVELEWDDMTWMAGDLAFERWFRNLTVEEIRENWGMDIIRSYEIEQKAKELCK
jgi:hypothetical protein